MNRLKFLLLTLVVAVVTLGIYSCAKEGSPIEAKSQDAVVQSRASGGCSPESIYNISTGCVSVQRDIPIDFSLGLDLYSLGSTLYQLCPGVQFNVSYTFTTCNFGSSATVHFIHNLTYNLADIIAACPALQAEINNQQSLGNLVGFLDLLDFDISKQVEFTEAYNAALLAAPTKYLCERGGEFYDVKFIQNSCFKWVPFTKLPTKEDPRPIPAFEKEPCDGSICCIRIGQYCVREFYNGQPVLDGSGNSSYERTEGECPKDCTHECGNPFSGADDI